MLRGVDGFDLCDYGRVFLKYNRYADGFNQGNVVSGIGGGQAVQSFNSAFDPTGAQFVRQYDSQPVWGLHFDYMQAGGSGVVTPRAFEFYRITLAGALFFSLHQRNDGRFDMFGPGSALIGTTAIGITPNVNVNVQVLINFGTSGSVQVLFNDSNALGVVTSIPFNFGASLPDTHMWFWNGGFGPPGIQLDNYVVWDGQPGDSFGNAFPGPMSVTSLEPNTDDPSTLWTPSSGTTCVPMVNDFTNRFPGESPDGDFTTIAPSTLAAQGFLMKTSPCFGLVLGVAMNACARPLSAPQLLDFQVGIGGNIYVVGNATVSTPFFPRPGGVPPQLQNYQTYQVLVGNSPASGSNWNDAEINGASWGLGAGVSPNQLITAFYLEKVTSLRPQPFNCGGGNYSF